LDLDEARHSPLDDRHGVRRRAAPLRRTAGIDDPTVVEGHDLRLMRVPVCDEIAVGKPPT
jgi:hypothetical protein